MSVIWYAVLCGMLLLCAGIIACSEKAQRHLPRPLSWDPAPRREAPFWLLHPVRGLKVRLWAWQLRRENARDGAA